MFELTDTAPAHDVSEAEYKRLLGFPADYVLEGRARELADATRAWYEKNGRPWIYAREIETSNLDGSQVSGGGAVFHSQQLHDNFKAAQAHSAVAAVFSAGRECEEAARQFWREGKPDEYFFMEMYGSAVVERLVAVASGRICGWADGQGMVALPHYSPGYSGWDVAEQGKLWSVICEGNGRPVPGELTVMESGMLRPKKSLLALFGVTRHLDKVKAFARLVPCEHCSLPNCQYRRAPYQFAFPQIEDVRRLQTSAAGGQAPVIVSESGLRHDAKYSINVKALRKWAQERLQLKTRPDGFLEAQFRYEGTTCSNMGRPLEFQYTIILSPAPGGHRITETSCRPAPGDTGHAYQCEYLKDAEGFMNSIDSEKPLRGCPLNDVLAWERSFSPSGCYCDPERRSHKWGLVFEVIHYALVQREKTAAEHRQAAAVLAP